MFFEAWNSLAWPAALLQVHYQGTALTILLTNNKTLERQVDGVAAVAGTKHTHHWCRQDRAGSSQAWQDIQSPYTQAFWRRIYATGWQHWSSENRKTYLCQPGEAALAQSMHASLRKARNVKASILVLAQGVRCGCIGCTSFDRERDG